VIFRKWICGVLLFMAGFSITDSTIAAEGLRVDCSQRFGKFKPLHGVNGGPLNYGETIDISDAWRVAGIPLARLHDCEWPGGRIADFHSLFPDLKADPADPQSYRFTETDAYLKAIGATGARVVFRLGESIEHLQTKVHVHPPADFQKWAAACVGIVRYYEARSGKEGFPRIDYWEIWNEPENQPVMWTGTNEQFYELYAITAKALRKEFPKLKIGGPALGATGEMKDGQFLPNKFLQGFMTKCREEKLPLDFFSWHTYTDNPAKYHDKAKGIRKWLDEQGYAASEIHLNEWNYLPDNDWSANFKQTSPAKRARWFERQGGAEGAAFAAYVLLDLQDCPIDAANFFGGDIGPFGLFSRFGEPKKNYFAFQAFNRLLSTPNRVAVKGGETGKWIARAGLNDAGDELQILVANFSGGEQSLTARNFPWDGATQIESWRTDAQREMEASPKATAEGNSVELKIAAGPSVQLFRCRARR
jgi:xylan 1,4-beta-xylosidase